MTERSGANDGCQTSNDRVMFRRKSSWMNQEFDAVATLTHSTGSSLVQNVTASDARNQKTDNAGDSCVETEFERLKKYPDYCRTITIRDSSGQLKELVFPKALDLDRPKRARTMFSSDQLRRLEEEFHRNQYLVGVERAELATQLGLSETQIKVWFQNRRTKHKRDTSASSTSSSAISLSVPELASRSLVNADSTSSIIYPHRPCPVLPTSFPVTCSSPGLTVAAGGRHKFTFGVFAAPNSRGDTLATPVVGSPDYCDLYSPFQFRSSS